MAHKIWQLRNCTYWRSTTTWIHFVLQSSEVITSNPNAPLRIYCKREMARYFLCKFNSFAVLGFLSSTNYYMLFEKKFNTLNRFRILGFQTWTRRYHNKHLWTNFNQMLTKERTICIYIKKNLSANIIKNLMLTVALK